MATVFPRSLLDPDLEMQLDERGWVVVPLLDQEEVAELRGWYLVNSEGNRHIPDGAYNDEYAEFSVIHTDPAFREAAFRHIVRVVCPKADALLQGFEPLVANFVNKPAHTGVVPTHQNWSVVDERRFRSLSVWVALVDCNRHNGTLELLARSHRNLRQPRGMWAYEAFAGLAGDVVDQLECVEVKAGEAIILDDAVVHYSRPNVTGHDRLAIQLIMVPAAAQALFFQCVSSDEQGMDVDVLEVSERFFWDFWHGDGDPRYGRVVSRLRLPPVSAAAALLVGDYQDVGVRDRSVPNLDDG